MGANRGQNLQENESFQNPTKITTKYQLDMESLEIDLAFENVDVY